MTELEAVNEMLATIGESPVPDLASGLFEADLALTKLRAVAREVQAEGWNFNTDRDFTLNPGPDGRIVKPMDALTIDSTRESLMQISERSGYLRDDLKQSTTFTAPLHCVIVRQLAFTDMPFPAQSYVYIKAGRKFQKVRLGSPTIDEFSKEDEAKALDSLERYDAEDQKVNLFRNNPWAAQLYKGR